MVPIALILFVAISLAAVTAHGKSSSKKIERRSSRLVSFTFDGSYVIESPETLRRQASKKLGRDIKLEDFALATAVASESGSKVPQVGKVAIAHAIINRSREIRTSLLNTIMPDGRFARQGIAGHSYVATSHPPESEHVTIAEQARTGRTKDPTGGASQFDSPSAQRAALTKGVSLYKVTPEQLAENRRAEGRVQVTVPGVPMDTLRFWKKYTGTV